MTELPVVLLALLGCHLFSPINITCVAGMACDTHSDTGGDTGGDSGLAYTGGDSGTGTGDTATATPTVGMAWLGTDTAGTAVGNTFAADGTPRADAVPLAPVPAGPFDVDGDTWLFAMSTASGPGTAVAAYSSLGLGAWVALPDDGSDGSVVPAQQVELVGGDGYVLTGAAVYRFDPADGTGAYVTVGRFLTLDVPLALAVDTSGEVWAVTRNRSSGKLVVYAFSPATVGGYTNTAYSEQPANGAARAMALGPDGAPHVCETDGTVRPAIGDGTTLPSPVVNAVRLADNEVVTDVTACAWDPGDASWRLFSATRGFLHASGDAAYVLVARDATMTPLAAGAFF